MDAQYEDSGKNIILKVYYYFLLYSILVDILPIILLTSLFMQPVLHVENILDALGLALDLLLHLLAFFSFAIGLAALALLQGYKKVIDLISKKRKRWVTTEK